MPTKVIADIGLQQISDTKKVEELVEEALSENEKAVVDYKAGKSSSFDFLLGAVMRKAKGSANPLVVREVLTSKLKNS
jgi:aspartyl-tRNA(Asn)/glutamyl-tRNA(Gln) amidotransferase subunit B